ncbi:uncharacterized protein LOC131323720 [Rhododendron vialii]|uniref:uncharacterized protein LOC131323720 n=1 Tax=Rhododendron vialii TaxID=182163 RepID=UPI00265EA581|nr:uncharacterized protein LOC131323720 [Rhododendron vialii]
MEYEKLCLLHYNELNLAEESWSRQKSRIRRLNLGDNNTKFFHKKVASHKMRNKIISICDDGGTRLEEPQAVKEEILRFYNNMFGSKFEHKRPTNERLTFTNTVPTSFHASLISSVTPDEVKVANFAINGYNLPSFTLSTKLKQLLSKEGQSLITFSSCKNLLGTVKETLGQLDVRICITLAMYSIVRNGELEGFFKGEKGLRQGDPISSYLFLLIMEGLYAILQKKISEGQFNYHPKCSALSISYFAFAYDLFLMAGTDCHSIAILKKALDDFYHSSGLKPNLLKSQIFFSGVNLTVKTDILSILPIPEGSLLVKYLGVPRISTRLKYDDCVQLKERTQQRIASWSNSLLSFWGRALLIQSKIMKEVEAMLRAFLWSGLKLKRGGAKVKWMEDTLWVKWVHNYIIKDQHFWVMKVPYDCSWTVRKILKLRGLGQNFVKHHIGNGLGTSLWYDNWHPRGPLYKILDDRTMSSLDTVASAKVSSVISNGVWHWPRPRNNPIHQIQMAIPGNLVPQIEMEDEVRWHISPNGQYTTKHTWEAIRSKSEKIPWASLVWLISLCSTYSFIAVIQPTFGKSFYPDFIFKGRLVYGILKLVRQFISVGILFLALVKLPGLSCGAA